MSAKEKNDALALRILERKRYLRSTMRVKRRNADPEWLLKASQRIQRALITQPEFIQAEAIGLYLALPYEVQTSELITAARKAGKRICAPAFNQEEARYELTWISEDDPLRPGPMNINEPTFANRAGLTDLDLMVVPAVAYDPYGGRLGHGGGHYDRILGAWSGIKVGVAFQFQIHDEVPMGSQDIPVDFVVTELHVYRDECSGVRHLVQQATITKQRGESDPEKPTAGR